MSKVADFTHGLFGLEGKRALVTGGASGVGRMISETLVRAGADVTIASRKGATCQQAARELSEWTGTCEGVEADLATEEGVLSLAHYLREHGDRLDILVNNSGRSWGAPYEQYPWEAWGQVMDLNVTGLFTLTRELSPMLERAGLPGAPARVINIGSVMGTVPHGFPAYAYSASKAAVHHVTRFLAAELAPRQIAVNAIAPGPFPSRMTAFFADQPEKSERVTAAVPLGRLGTPADMAGLVLCLCGAAGAYISGAVIPLDGGMSVYRAPGLEQGL